MNTPKTAMGEILEKCQDKNVSFEDLGRWVSASAYMLLEKEKQMVIDAWDRGNVSGIVQGYNDRPDDGNGEDYFNTTFKNDKS